MMTTAAVVVQDGGNLPIESNRCRGSLNTGTRQLGRKRKERSSYQDGRKYAIRTPARHGWPMIPQPTAGPSACCTGRC
jgi:hypothetical protein